MIVLILQLAALLLASAAIGLLVGWQIQRQRAAAQLSGLHANANRVCREERERAEGAIAKLDMATQELGSIKADNKQASRRLRNLTGALSDSESTIAGLEADVAALQQQLDGVQAQHKTELQQARSSTANQHDEAAGYAEQLAAVNSQLAALKVTLSERNSALESLKKVIDTRDATLNQMREQFTALRQQLDAARINEQQLRDELANTQMRAQDLEDKYQRLAARADSDDLKRIKGIGPVLEKSLKEHGITRFSQIAAFSAEDIESISRSLQTFPDRIRRDRWVQQAEQLKNESRQ